MQLIETKDSNYTVKIGNTTLHSKYSPVKEAEKFLSANLKSSGPVIVLGGGLGYLYSVLQKEYPDRKVISIPYSKEIQSHASRLNPTDREEFSGDNLEKFLKSIITEENIKGLEIIEWPPSAKVWIEQSQKCNEIIVKEIRQLNGNILTARRFGRRWLKNSIKNYLEINEYISEFKINRPIVIAASGKSLSSSIEIIKRERENICLIALSSATTALNFYNIEPDLIFSTDPGYYSKLHLYNQKGIIAMPLTNSTSAGNSVLLINQGNEFENDIINSAKLPYIKLGEYGTVAGTALMFALKNSPYNVYLAGQDLESSDIQSHIKPYAFDNLLQKESRRTSSYYSTMYKRWKSQGVTYKTYRDWFSATAKKFPGRIFRLEAESEKIDGILDIYSDKFSINTKYSKTEAITYNKSTYKDSYERSKIAFNILDKWLESINSERNRENYINNLISSAYITDINNKANSIQGKDESIQFIKRLISLYGRQLLQ